MASPDSTSTAVPAPPPVAGELVRPEPSTELLLHAALDPRPAALEAWRCWRSQAPAGPGEGADSRLRPLVWWNLGGPEAREAGVQELATSYAEAWGRFQELSAWAGEAVRALRAAGVAALLLKGLPLAVLHYERPALRPMADTDLLVAPRDRAAAAAVLQRLGYASVRQPAESAVGLMHSLGHQRPDGGSLDLHWFALLECCYAGADDELWTHAVACPIAGVEALAPDPAAMLLTVCAHGVRWSPGGHPTWVADAATLIRRHGETLDWLRLARLAAARGMSRRLTAALGYLVSEFGAAVPAATIERLAAAGSSWSERCELRLRQRPPGLVSGAVQHWFVHRRRVRAGAEPGGVASFARYLQAAWGLSSPWRVPAAAVARSWSRRWRGPRRRAGQ